ncbi:hypothetical protein CBU02nite_16300 [Clostridium butyricum]|uniref:Phage capsid-like C-terminal domain-containing protein n=1 Tax=Clostridium butyricum TaxID=1492 RepID=A0A512TLI0_CLOBU|nr:phage major capsid protein [Clostridium butyricum]MBS5982827.1 phage major capsid protein [Clostridium butyricum]NOW23929.1 HK97 family phage major capsid protein [Clostridium butyricum]GEQ21124.1 hypothetical protein CBU02nite_16300 [Clostridium butyricum]
MADTTFLKDNLAGTVPVEICKEIMKNIIDQASILKVSKKISMTSDTMVIPKLIGTGSAAWVNEGEEIGTTLPTFDYPKLKAKKLAIIVPVTREKINDSVSNVIGEVKQAISDMFASAIDLACIFGTETPFDTNLITSIGENKITSTSALNTDLSDAMGLVEDNKYNCNNILMGTTQKKVLRALANDNKYKGAITLSSAYDTPIEYVRNWNDTKSLVITGDFTRSIVGTRENMEYEILKEATIKSGADTINLAQRDMIGIKCTMRMAYLVADSKAFSMVVSA